MTALRSAFAVSLLAAFALAAPARAENLCRPDDTVALDLSGEDWVATKTAHVVLRADAAVSASEASSVRADMTKAVEGIARGDWRLSSFTRAPDQTGLERWSAAFDARLPEDNLAGLAEAAKKAGRAGMQIGVESVDFTPSLDEVQAARSALRSHLYKQAADELAVLDAALPGRAYRIAHISFDDAVPPQPLIQPRIMMAAAMSTPQVPDSSSGVARAEKITETAHVTFAAAPPATAPAPAAAR